jgi:hypothetical protein
MIIYSGLKCSRGNEGRTLTITITMTLQIQMIVRLVLTQTCSSKCKTLNFKIELFKLLFQSTQNGDIIHFISRLPKRKEIQKATKKNSSAKNLTGLLKQTTEVSLISMYTKKTF